jgi:hypothetical protein
MPDTPASVIVEVAPNPDPVEAYDITVNGRQVATRDLHFLGGADQRAEKKTLPVPLEHGDNVIRITARNRIGTAERGLLLRFLGRSELDRRGVLYVVAVGVDDYSNSRANSLRFAGADARAFCEAMLRHAGCMSAPNACCSPGAATRNPPARTSKTPCCSCARQSQRTPWRCSSRAMARPRRTELRVPSAGHRRA